MAASSPTRSRALTLFEASYPGVQYVPLADVDIRSSRKIHP